MQYYKSIQLAIMAIAFTSCQIALGDISQKSLQEMTEDIVEQGDVKILPPEFDWDRPSLSYYLGHVDFDCPNRWRTPLQAQFTVTLIRRYRNDRFQRRFWEPVLRDVESEIGEMVRLIQRGNMNERELSEALFKRSKKIRELYQSNLSDLAKENGKQGAAPMCPDFEKFTVTFISDPPGAKIRLVVAVEQEYYDLLREQNEPLHGWTPRSIMVKDRQQIPIYGKYILYADWPNGQSAKDVIRVRGKCTIEVMPD